MPKKMIVLLVSILAFSIVVFSAAMEIHASTVQIDNEYIRVVVNTRENNTGRFAVGTTGGDPNRETDQNKHLIYGGDDPWTSYTTIRIDNKNWVYGNPTDRRAGRNVEYGDMLQSPTIVDDTIQSSWQLGPIRVEQILGITRGSTTGLLDTAQIVYYLENTDSEAHMVGVRLMLDTMLGSNDGVPFRVEDQSVTTDTIYYAHNMPQYWLALDSLINPQVISQGTLSGPGVTIPDRVYFTNWGSLADSVWNVELQQGRDFMRAGEFELDSAIALYWDPVWLEPGESITYSSQYGLGGVTITPGDLYLGLTSPDQVTADSDGIQTFTVLALVENAGKGDALDVSATLTLPEGLELVGGEKQIQLGDLKVNESRHIGWTVRTLPNVEGQLSFTVEATAENSEPTLQQKNITIMAPPKLTVQISSEPAAMSVKDEKYDPSVFLIEAKVKNEGGSAVHNAFLQLLSSLSLVGDQSSKRYVGTIEPGEELITHWRLEPTDQYGTEVPYTVSVITDQKENREYKVNMVSIPILTEKIWIGTPSQRDIAVGDYFSLPIWATNFRDFQGVELDISFDPNLVSIVGRTLDVAKGTLFVADNEQVDVWQMPIISNKDGTAQGLLAKRADSIDHTYGTIVNIYFTAKNPGVSLVKIDRARVLTDQGWQEIDLDARGETQIGIEPKL